jgi:hypothetical protein
MMPCPFCHAPEIANEVYRFECGTKHIPGMDNVQFDCNHRHDICYEREIRHLKDIIAAMLVEREAKK